jgi:sugar O-acyltransferase (sialic acid O-acetyltransferase NeuD family)
MESLIIVGAGGLARETLEAVDAVNDIDPTWSFLGFADDDPDLQGASVAGHPVLGPVGAVDDHPEARLLVCVASPTRNVARKALAERLGPPERFATVVHPAATVSRSTVLGPGTIVLAGTVTTADVGIGAHVIVMPGVVLTHDDVVKDFATFGAGARLGGRAHVGEGAYIGSGASVREDRSIGSWSLVGMGAVVTKDVPPYEVWVGAPARFIRTLATDPLQAEPVTKER